MASTSSQAAPPPAGPGAADSGSEALAFALQGLGLPADAAEIRHQSGRAKLDEGDLLRAARRFPVKVRPHRSSFARLQKTPLPALALLRDGRWLVIGRVSDEKLLVQHAGALRPDLLTRDEFAKLWTGRLILLTRRTPLNELGGRFGFGWFLSAVRRYRGPLSEVLLA